MDFTFNSIPVILTVCLFCKQTTSCTVYTESVLRFKTLGNDTKWKIYQ